MNAFIWDQSHGIRNLQHVLEAEYAMDFGGWTLANADVISNDGNVIVGRGLAPDGSYRGWLINLVPEPASLAPLAAAGLLLQRHRRRRAKTICYSSRTDLCNASMAKAIRRRCP